MIEIRLMSPATSRPFATCDRRAFGQEQEGRSSMPCEPWRRAAVAGGDQYRQVVGHAMFSPRESASLMARPRPDGGRAGSIQGQGIGTKLVEAGNAQLASRAGADRSSSSAIRSSGRGLGSARACRSASRAMGTARRRLHGLGARRRPDGAGDCGCRRSTRAQIGRLNSDGSTPGTGNDVELRDRHLEGGTHRRRARREGRDPGPYRRWALRKRPVCDALHAATCSGVPVTTTCAAGVSAFGPEVDDVVGRLDDVEVVLDEQHRVAGVDEPVRATRAAARRRRGAGRWSARRGCRACASRAAACSAPSRS